MKSVLKKLKVNNIIDGIVCLGVGLVMLFWTGMSLELIVSVFAVMLIIAGAISVISYFVKHENPLIGYGAIVVGAMVLVLGIWIFTHNHEFQAFIPTLFGIMMIVSGFANLIQAGSLIAYRYRFSWLSLIFAVATIVLGFVFVLRPLSVAGALIRIMGIILVYNGISDIWITSRLSRFIKDVEKEIELEESEKNAIDVDAVIEEEKV